MNPSLLPLSLSEEGLDQALHWPYKSLDLVEALLAQGVSEAEALAGGGWTLAGLREPAPRVAPRQHLQICRNALRHVADPLFGLRAGMRLGVTQLGPYGALLRACPDAAEALRCGLAYRALTMPLVEVQSRVDAQGIELLLLNPLQLEPALFGFLCDYQIGLQLRLQQDLLGSGLAPLACLRHEARPAHAVALERALGCRVLWGQAHTSLQLPLALLAGRNPAGSAVALASLEQGFAELLARLSLQRSWQGRVVALLAQAGKPWPQAAELAARLGISERGLRRQLALEGQSFQALSDAQRMQRACQLLRQPDSSVESVSDALGFADPSGFRQAFRRLRGLSPREYRDQAAVQAATTRTISRHLFE